MLHCHEQISLVSVLGFPSIVSQATRRMKSFAPGLTYHNRGYIDMRVQQKVHATGFLCDPDFGYVMNSSGASKSAAALPQLHALQVRGFLHPQVKSISFRPSF